LVSAACHRKSEDGTQNGSGAAKHLTALGISLHGWKPGGFNDDNLTLARRRSRTNVAIVVLAAAHVPIANAKKSLADNARHGREILSSFRENAFQLRRKQNLAAAVT